MKTRICYILLLVALLGSLPAMAQRSDEEMYAVFLGDVPSESFVAAMKANHVSEVRKVMPGNHAMTMKLDAAGPLIYCQYDYNTTADSMVYDDQNRIIAWYVLSAGGVYGHVERVYHKKDELYDDYIVDAKGRRDLSHVTALHKKDTGIVTTLRSDGRRSENKSWNVGEATYTLFSEYTSEGEEQEERMLYFVYDAAYYKKHHTQRLLEQGEVRPGEGAANYLVQLLTEMVDKRRIDTPLMRDIYNLKNEKDLSEVKRLFKKHHLPMEKLTEDRKIEKAYTYDDKDRVTGYKGYGGSDSYTYTYNDKGQLATAIRRDGYSVTTTTYTYDKKGLLIYTEMGTQTADYVYTFY